MQGRLLNDASDIQRAVRSARRVAVVGIKTEAQRDQPAFYVPEYLVDAGLEVVPVPVYYPQVTEILGVPVYRRLADVPGELDVAIMFRRPVDLMAHLDDVLAKGPKLVWLQSGIREPNFARALTDAGIDVVQDRCFMVEHRRAGH
jgi:predicted CoA-binding protein